MEVSSEISLNNLSPNILDNEVCKLKNGSTYRFQQIVNSVFRTDQGQIFWKRLDPIDIVRIEWHILERQTFSTLLIKQCYFYLGRIIGEGQNRLSITSTFYLNWFMGVFFNCLLSLRMNGTPPNNKFCVPILNAYMN